MGGLPHPSPERLGAIAARLGELRFLGEVFDRLSREYRRRGTASH